MRLVDSIFKLLGVDMRIGISLRVQITLKGYKPVIFSDTGENKFSRELASTRVFFFDFEIESQVLIV